MQNERKCAVFLKKRDRYSQSINLTYNGLKKYPTVVGGLLTILTTLIVMTWLSLNVMAIINFDNTVSQDLTVTNAAGQPSTIWEIGND